MSTWYENEEFWKRLKPVLFTPERWTSAPNEVDQIITLLGLKAGSAVLDVGCGPGRHSLEFARRGFHVTGIDRTAGYLSDARSNAAQQGLDAEFVQADMREFSRPAAFDVAVSLLTSFGYFENPGDDVMVLEHIHASLKPGGHLAMELMGKEVLARMFRQRDWQEIENVALLLEERRLSEDWGRLDVRWTVLSGNARSDYQFSLRLYSAVELITLLRSAGFEQSGAYGSLGGTPYDHQAERLVIVARKPHS